MNVCYIEKFILTKIHTNVCILFITLCNRCKHISVCRLISSVSPLEGDPSSVLPIPASCGYKSNRKQTF